MELQSIRRLLSYDPLSGVVSWLVNRGSGKAGCEAGYVNETGYRRVSVLGREHPSHRIAWLLHYGSWPSGEVDHINGDKLDNRIENLRDISVQENRQNLRVAKVTNKSSGLLGVYRTRCGKGWKSQIRHDGKIVYLGRFDTPELAHKAYIKAKRELHKGCSI